MSEFHLEILSEEIPARMQHNGVSALENKFCAKFNEHSLQFDSVRSYSSPQRLIFVAFGLPDIQPDNIQERRGPKVDSSPESVSGFLRSSGYDSLDHPDVFRKSMKEDEYYMVRRRVAGKKTKMLLSQLVQEVLADMRWPKSMRWGAGGFRWVRPIESILCIFNGELIDGHVVLGKGNISNLDTTLAFGRTTRGHRFLSPKSFSPNNFADYEKKLKAAFVEIDAEKRKETIKTNAIALAEEKGLSAYLDEEIVDENSGLVEWPVVLIGGFDKEFLELPNEVLITSMRKHQKYFPLYTKAGELAPWFVMVANIETKPGVSSIVEGNERVLRARLYDAKFFWDTDTAVSLDTHAERLSEIVFHAKLGSIKDRVIRVSSLASEIGKFVSGVEDQSLRRAAALCKADLVTGMVGEFPELQGVMGKYYALLQGEGNIVAEAIVSHYAPLGPTMPCPKEPNSLSLALADKIDTLVGMFVAGERATGSKDPFALRRAALGVVRIILENRVRLSLAEIVHSSSETYASQRIECGEGVARDVVVFVLERLKVYLSDCGFRHDILAASFAVSDDSDLYRLKLRAEALRNFLSSCDGSRMLSVYNRAMNIVGIEEKKQKENYRGTVVPELFSEAAEISLFERLTSVQVGIEVALADENFVDVMKSVADLGAAIATFFDDVQVNIEDERVRKNRLCLLGRIGTLLESIADFSAIEG
jgi:glycyl-tRNA synthetase beta chain